MNCKPASGVRACSTLFMTLLQKVGPGGEVCFLVGVALEYSGFVSEAPQQPDSALLAIRTFIGPVPMVLFDLCSHSGKVLPPLPGRCTRKFY